MRGLGDFFMSAASGMNPTELPSCQFFLPRGLRDSAPAPLTFVTVEAVRCRSTLTTGVGVNYREVSRNVLAAETIAPPWYPGAHNAIFSCETTAAGVGRDKCLLERWLLSSAV